MNINMYLLTLYKFKLNILLLMPTNSIEMKIKSLLDKYSADI